ncbi:MAG: hypothetical protein OES79_12895, partial [Planctomycetota bacterium]|nr:hypothetical protein [Planctomycetota bacterium]
MELISEMNNFFSLLQSRATRRRKRTGGRQRLARFESLEPRHLLAGNVTAAVVDGDLRLTGDSLDNTAMVSVIDGDVVVEGLDDTTVNGSATPFIAFSGSSRIADDLLARLGGGGDVLLLAGGLEVADRVSISG